MGKILEGLIGFAGVAVVYGLMLCVLLFYTTAATAGAEAWFGWNTGWAALAALVAILAGGPLGALAVSIIGGYGALFAWEWPWYFVILVFFPVIPVMAGSALFSLLGMLFGRRA